MLYYYIYSLLHVRFYKEYSTIVYKFSFQKYSFFAHEFTARTLNMVHWYSKDYTNEYSVCRSHLSLWISSTHVETQLRWNSMTMTCTVQVPIFLSLVHCNYLSTRPMHLNNLVCNYTHTSFDHFTEIGQQIL